MDRRELIKVLTGGIAGLPAVDSIQRLELRSQDRLVVKVKGLISDDQAARIKAIIERNFPERIVMVIDNTIDLQVIRNAE